VNISKMWGSMSPEMPLPLSRTRMMASLPTRSALSPMWPPDGVYRALLLSWLCDSSKAKYRQRSPRWQEASARWALILVLPVPAVPESSTLLPR
jgi:hypothetical protein